MAWRAMIASERGIVGVSYRSGRLIVVVCASKSIDHLVYGVAMLDTGLIDWLLKQFSIKAASIVTVSLVLALVFSIELLTLKFAIVFSSVTLIVLTVSFFITRETREEFFGTKRARTKAQARASKLSVGCSNAMNLLRAKTERGGSFAERRSTSEDVNRSLRRSYSKLNDEGIKTPKLEAGDTDLDYERHYLYLDAITPHLGRASYRYAKKEAKKFLAGSSAS
jgi:hypothetical protein